MAKETGEQRKLRVWHHSHNSDYRYYEAVNSLVEARLVINALQWYTLNRGLEVLENGKWVEWQGERGDIYFYLLEELRAGGVNHG